MSHGEYLPAQGAIGRAGLAAAAAAAGSVALAVVMLAPLEQAGMAVLFLTFGLPIALFHVFVLGLPLYLRLRRRWPLRWWSAGLGGFFVGAAPIASLSLPGLLRDAYSDAGPVIYDGPPLVLRVLLYAFEAGLPGLVGGLTFWLVLRRSGSCR